MKKILVTGGSGFIGTNIIDYYKDKCEILNLDINSPRNPDQLNLWKNVDLLEKQKLINAFIDFKPEYVFHMGARTDLHGKTLDDYNSNTQGVENIIEAISKTDSIKKVIFASSRLVCEIGYKPKDEFDYKPSTVYGESKIIGEKIIRNSKNLKIDWIIVRPTSLWGPWFDVPYKTFFDTIKRKAYFHPSGVEIYKKFGYVGNCVFIMDKLLENENLNKKTVYLSDFKMLEVNAWANIISQKFHKKNVQTMPLIALKTMALAGDFAKVIGFKNAPITNFRLNNLLTNMDYDTDDVEQVVGKLPFCLQEAVDITYNWYKII